MKVYVNTLENINAGMNGLGISNSTECMIKDLELNTKYVVSYVPYNIYSDDGMNAFFIMFLTAL